MMEETGATQFPDVAPGGGVDGGGGGGDRRDFLKKAGVGAAAAWTAPMLLSTTAHAQGTDPQAPEFVPGSADTGFSGPTTGTRSVTLTSGSAGQPLLPGDLWIGLGAYSQAGALNPPSGPGWTVWPAESGGDGIYSVQGIVVTRVLTAADIVSGQFTATYTTSSNDATFGGLRAAAVAYRGTDLTVAVTGLGVTQGGSTPSTATVTFPAAIPTPAATPNAVVRLGAARGYGGYLAGQDINWQGSLGTDRVNDNSSNTGDRALAISEQIDGTAVAQTRDYFTAFLGARHRAAFTAVITNA